MPIKRARVICIEAGGDYLALSAFRFLIRSTCMVNVKVISVHDVKVTMQNAMYVSYAKMPINPTRSALLAFIHPFHKLLQQPLNPLLSPLHFGQPR